MSQLTGKQEKHRKLPFIYAPSRSVSLLTSVLIFQSNSNCRCMTFAHVAILLSFVQQDEEYLMALKDFAYSCSLGYKRTITSKSKDVT